MFTFTHLLWAFGAGALLGLFVSGFAMYAFWHGFFHGFVVELTAGLARMVAAECERSRD